MLDKIDRSCSTGMNIIKESLLLLCLLALSIPTHAAIKCWENDDGVKECGEKIPPQYSQKSHKTISSQGITVESSPRAQTKEELQEAKEIAKIKAVEDAIKAKQLEQDRILLNTYSNTSDIQISADSKIKVIESIIRLTEKRNSNVQSNIEKLNKRSETIKSGGKTLPKYLQEQLQSLEKQTDNNKKFIVEKVAEQKNIKEEYAEKIKRFNELTGKGG